VRAASQTARGERLVDRERTGRKPDDDLWRSRQNRVRPVVGLDYRARSVLIDAHDSKGAFHLETEFDRRSRGHIAKQPRTISI
jgi:hypothetical protein